MYKILIVEDEQSIRDMVQEYLGKQFYEVLVAADGELGLQAVLDNNPDIVLLDLMLPKKNGLEVCKEIRKLERYIPIIMLTARGQKSDIIVGLEVGADDYIVKPFSLEELEARIKAIMRRHQAVSQKEQSNQGSAALLNDSIMSESEIITREPFAVDKTKYQLYKNDQELKLTPTEYQIFTLMFKSPGRVYTRLQLLELALGEEYQGYERSIDTHIRNLRQKVEEDASYPQHILTVHGIGYKYNEK